MAMFELLPAEREDDPVPRVIPRPCGLRPKDNRQTPSPQFEASPRKCRKERLKAEQSMAEIANQMRAKTSLT
jgi:hypothetical protein